MKRRDTMHDPRDRFPRDDVSQLIFAVVGAIAGTALGGAVALGTGSDTLDLSFLWHCLVVVPFSATGVGLVVAWAWDTVVKWATQVGRPLQDLREPGQQVTLAVAGLVPVAAGLFFMLVAPWLAGWTALLLLAASAAEPAYLEIRRQIRRVWDIVK